MRKKNKKKNPNRVLATKLYFKRQSLDKVKNVIKEKSIVKNKLEKECDRLSLEISKNMRYRK